MRFFVKAILALIKLYQRFISPLKKPCCRFYPTCSRYAYMAIEKYGLVKGGYMTIKRLLKCHPFNDGGIDEVE